MHNSIACMMHGYPTTTIYGMCTVARVYFCTSNNKNNSFRFGCKTTFKPSIKLGTPWNSLARVAWNMKYDRMCYIDRFTFSLAPGDLEIDLCTTFYSDLKDHQSQNLGLTIPRRRCDWLRVKLCQVRLKIGFTVQNFFKIKTTFLRKTFQLL